MTYHRLLFYGGLLLFLLAGHSAFAAPAVKGDAATSEAETNLHQLEGEYVQYLPLLQSMRPFDPALHDEVGLFVDYSQGSIGTKVFTLRLDGSPSQLVYNFQTDGYIADVTWSPNGEKIFFTLQEGNEKTSYTINRDGTMLTSVQFGANYAPTWSPDSRHLLFNSTVYDTVTQERNLVIGSSGTIRWSPDSQTLISLKDIDPSSTTVYNIFASDADGSNPRQLTTSTESLYFLEWLNGGAEFVARVGDTNTSPLYLYRANGTPIAPLATELGVKWISVAPDTQSFVYFTESLYLYNLASHESTLLPIPSCYDDSETCFSSLSWAPSSDLLSIGTMERGQPGQPDDYQFWIVPLTPTPQIPETPFSTLYYYGIWLNDRYFVAGNTLVDREIGIHRPLFLSDENGSRWNSRGWRRLPDE